MLFDVADNVPDDQVELIETALALAADYADRLLGGAIPGNVADISTVEIVAAGDSWASASASFSDGKFHLFFDVAHPQWNQDSTWRGWTTESDSMKTVVHEYTHAWQMWLGAFKKPLGGALNEGIAEYVAYSAMVDAGRMSWDDVRPFMLNGAYQSHELDGPLQEVEQSIWAGHAGFLAVDWLVGEAPSGIASLRTLALEIGGGASVADAFRTAFNIELADFQSQFEAWRQIILDDVPDGYANRPLLINIGDSEDGATAGPDTIVGTPDGDDIAGLGGDDDISGRAGKDTLSGNRGDDTLSGGKGADQLSGDKGGDELAGGKGADTLNGGNGHDTLEGGSGRDVFVFDRAPAGRHSDIIADFRPDTDIIALDDAVFTALDAGALADRAFHASTTGRAHDRSDRIMYETDTGKLFYDGDGSRDALDRVLVARLDPQLALGHDDFLIV